MIMIMNELSPGKWLERQWIEWDRETGIRHTQKEFARESGIEPGLMNKYLADERSPSGDNLEKIARRWGPGIYDATGRQRPDPVLDQLRELYDATPPEEVERIMQEWRKRMHQGWVQEE